MFTDLLTENNLPDFQKALIGWWKKQGRDYPWRNTRNPYDILVAEKLLQQTRACDVVVQAYETILSEYPDAQQLSVAEAEKLQEIIRPLGLVYRAEELVSMAREVTESYSGRVPANLRQLRDLPGVGQYAARAVLSFAYGEDAAVVDTNVARFLFRVYKIAEPKPTNPARKRWLVDLATNLLPCGRSREFNLAILDLCAEVCLPRMPLCEICPVHQYCLCGSQRQER